MVVLSFIRSKGVDLGNGELCSQALKRAVHGFGFDLGGLTVTLQGDTVLVAGERTAPDQAEKIMLALGNVKGVAEVRALMRDQDIPDLYTVVPGDTLDSIAQFRLGDASLAQRILHANAPMIPTPDAIYPGLVLRVPRLSA